MKYAIISANRAKNRGPKNWRIFEREAAENHFGPVLDVNGEDGQSVLEAYKKYQCPYVRWYPDPERMTTTEYAGMLRQSKSITAKYLASSAEGFAAVQRKEVAFDIWQKQNIRCPEYFVFDSERDFRMKVEEKSFRPPFLIRLNNSVSGLHSFLVNRNQDIDEYMPRLIQDYQVAIKSVGTNTKMICVKMIDTVDWKRNVNVSFRIAVAGNHVVSGYARVSEPDDWVVITQKFSDDNAENWVYYNEICAKICDEHEAEICQAVHCLNLNHQGIDVVIEQKTGLLYFIEVQPTYAAGYPNGYGKYQPPFYNPSYPNLVKFLIDNEKTLRGRIPMYYDRWLDKRHHFDLAYRYLKEWVG